MAAFFKVSGAGNDFVALAEPAADPAAEEIRAWCRRGISLGADGVFVLRRQGATAGIATVVMTYFNADGRQADLCLNGTRCAAQLAFHLGWARDRVEIATPAGPVLAHQLDPTRVSLELPAPDAEPRELALEAAGRTWRGWSLPVGVPHFTLLWPGDLAEAPVAEIGALLRRDAAFAPAGTNVHFICFPDPARMEIRSYERGVEEETLACGSGVVSAAAVGLALGLARLPLAVATWSGFELQVAEAAPGGPPGMRIADRWILAGDARVLAHGELLPGALQGSTPPSSAMM